MFVSFKDMAGGAGFDPRQQLFTLAQAAAVLGVPVRTLRDEAQAGRLETVRLKHRARPVYTDAAALDRWMREEWG